MPFYRSVGSVPPKRHTQHRDPEGRLYREELMGEEGFSSDSSLLYHRGVPSGIVDSQVWELPDQSRTPNHPLKPRHLKLHALFPEPGEGEGACPVEGRRMVLGNNDVRIGYVVTGTDPSPLLPQRHRRRVRVRRGRVAAWSRPCSGSCPTAPRTTCSSRGRRPIGGCRASRAGSTRSRPTPTSPRPSATCRGSASCSSTRRTASATCTARARPFLVDGTGDVEVLVKHRVGGQVVGTRMTYDTHPFDVVGWDGCLYPYTFNLEDYMPITGKIHQPPPVHQVFEGWNFVVCNFLPRKVDYHPLSIPVPYYHSNVDSDEIMFYVGGDYEARKGSGINLGSISVHPGGYAHGPQPSAIEASLGAEKFDETAVMIDTFQPLDLGEARRRGRGPGVRLELGRPAHRRRRGLGEDGGPAVYSNS